MSLQTEHILYLPATRNNQVMGSLLPAYHFYNLTSREDGTLIENRLSDRKNTPGELLYELISPEGIHFWHYNFNGATQRAFVVENPNAFVQIVFSIYNNSTIRLLNEQTPVASFDNYEYNMLFFPPVKTGIDWLATNKRELFILNVLPGIFRQYFNDHPICEALELHESNGQAVKMNPHNLPVTPAIRTILYDILNCPLEHYYKRLYLKAKVFELLTMLFSQQEQLAAEQAPAIAGLRQLDIDKMQHAREILHENITNPCSLIDLAHQVGTNENYLKKHFKQVFGNTVYGYIQELRMQQARQLLMKNEHSIQEVAQLSGYKHLQHFIVAFKKYFGYSPV